MPDCINLKTTFGTRYQIGFDPAYDPRGKARKDPDPWMLTIPCRYGTIYPSGGDKLRVDIDGHTKIAKQVARLAGCRLVQDGDDEKTFEFALDSIDVVADLVKPRLIHKSRDNVPMIGQQTRFGISVETASDLVDERKDAS